MGHAVYHRTASGEAQLEDVSSLEAALELVERLRNEEGPTDVRLLKEIPVEVRTYYRVVAAAETESPAPKPADATTEVVVDGEPAQDAVAADVEDAHAEVDEETVADVVDEPAAEVDEPEVAEDEAPAASATLSEPPAGAMPLLSPPPVTVHANDNADAEPVAAASGGEGRPRLFNRS